MEITKNQLERLETLDALEAGGVDNWEGYGPSMEELQKEREKEEELAFAWENIEQIICEGVDEPAGSGAGFGITDSAGAEGFEAFKKAINEFGGK